MAAEFKDNGLRYALSLGLHRYACPSIYAETETEFEGDEVFVKFRTNGCGLGLLSEIKTEI